MNLFDIIGPVMIGPSSSHTAGACRIGLVARRILNDTPVSADITLCGSFAQTYRGHGTDRAIIAGILGMKTDDERLPESFDVAKKEGLRFAFSFAEIPDAHPNTAVIQLKGKGEKTCEIQAASIGGGNIMIHQVNGTKVAFSGQYNTLIVMHTDEAGVIAGVSHCIADAGVNIATFSCYREEKGGQSIMTIEIDGLLSGETMDELRKQPAIHSVVQVRRI